ncbi:MAG: DNA polymerase III subunit epsilon, partial [Gammaproteobacteria bacterium]
MSRIEEQQAARTHRQVVLDTETTGMDPAAGHRIIEIGCVEMVGRRLTQQHYHVYINPDRQVDEGAIQVHGITNEYLADKPRFADIAQAFMTFVAGAELIIHNAAFDVGFINHELQRLAQAGGEDFGTLEQHCTVLDTLKLAREKHPGQRNSLDALCRRYEVDNTQRTLHGALLDSEILAEVYLAMTGGQLSLDFGDVDERGDQSASGIDRSASPWEAPRTPILRATPEELAA